MKKSLWAHVCLFLAQVIYALNYSIAKDLMPQNNGPIEPLALVFLRITGAGILFWLIGLFIPEKIDKKDFIKLLLLAALGVAINQGFFIYGLSKTEPINSAIIMISSPISVLLLSVYFFKEQINVKKIAGIGIGVTGALTLLLFNRSFEIGSNTLTGDFFTLINSISWACFMIMAKPMLEKYNTITVMKWLFAIGFIYFFPFGIKDVTEIKYTALSAGVWWSLGFVVVGTTFFAYLLNTFALKKLSSSVVASYIYIQPFLASIIATIWGKDELYAKKIVAGILIICGVWLVSKGNSQTKEN
jgi:drug/metabolite transporter (DMT)-like permease